MPTTKLHASSSGIDVLNTSVTEIMLLGIFFVLLAFAIIQDDLSGAEASAVDLHTKLSEQETTISQLRERLEEFKKTAGLTNSQLEERLFKRKTRIDNLTKENGKLKIRNDDLTKLSDDQSRLIKFTKKTLAAVEYQRDKLKTELEKMGAKIEFTANIEGAINSIKRIAAANDIDPDAPLDIVVSKLEKRIGDLKNALNRTTHLNKKLNKKLGLKEGESENLVGQIITPSCWKSDSRRADALFDISIGSKGFKVSAAWPKVRNHDAKNINSVRAMLEQNYVSVGQFRAFGRKLRAESERRHPPCIFVVNVNIDKTNNPSATQFNRLRNVAGLFFYIR